MILDELAEQHGRMVECAIKSGEEAKAHAAVARAFALLRQKNQVMTSDPLVRILPSRISSILGANGIETIGDLIQHSRESLAAFNQIRYRSVDLIEQELQKHGLRLRPVEENSH